MLSINDTSPSIGAAARREGHMDRNRLIMSFAGLLKQWEKVTTGQVIIVNQIATIVDESRNNQSQDQGHKLSNLHNSQYRDPVCERFGLAEPALGLVWANCVRTRIAFDREIDDQCNHTAVSFCPVSSSTMGPNLKVMCSIDQAGLRYMSDISVKSAQ
eukprot:GHVH01000637.1.p1 GENE.GHVH01000637.1~~GHVH01000637.1.p1  ORF type:complete len:158 (+),score=11.24 GHVH01000637.1:742-1215(+)